MTVEVVNLQSGGGHAPIVSYSENFNRADQPFYLGNNWWTEMVSTGNTTTGQILASNINVGSGVATFGGGGQAAQTMYCNLCPAVIDYNAVVARSLTRGLFSQMTLSTIIAGAGMIVGPAVFQNPNRSTGYILGCTSTTGTADVFRNFGTAAVNIGNGIPAFVSGDVIRIECNLSPAGNVIRSYKNSVLQTTKIDTAGLGPQAGGIFGIHYFLGAIGSISCSLYSGGLL